MASKLKIIVDYPCDIFCDYKYKGKAQPNSIFTIEIQKGQYFLEFKDNNKVLEFMDYTMNSNEQEDLLRVKLLTEIEFNEVLYNSISETLRDNDPNFKFCGDIFIKWNIEDKNNKTKIKHGYKKQYLRKVIPNSFNIIFEEKSYDENNTICKIEYNVEFESNNIPCKINIDTTWLHCNYRNYYGKFVIYMDKFIKIFYIKDSKITTIKTINSKAGFIYNLANETILTIKDNKFGIYDIINDRVLCPNKYDELYCEYVEYHGEIYHGFFDTNKYTIELDNKKGVINSKGELLLPCEYDIANPCSIGYIVKKELYWGLSHYGEKPTQWYDDIFTSYQTPYGITYAHLFEETKEIIETDNYPCSHILYFKKDKKYGYWDFNGKQCKILFDYIETNYLFGDSTQRLIQTRIGKNIGFIDCFGQEIIPCKYEEIHIENHLNPNLTLYCDYKLLAEQGIKTKFISETEQAAKNSKLYDINLTIEHLLSLHIEYQEPKYIAKLNGKFGINTISGKNLLPFIYDSIKEEYNNHFLVEKNGLFGILRSDKEIIFPINYTNKEQLKKDFAKKQYDIF